MFTNHVYAWFLKQTPFMGNASGNLWEEPSQAPHCHTSIVQRHVTAGDSHHHSAGAHVPTGKPGELQTAATPLGTFSRKDYTDLTWCACSSPPGIENRHPACPPSSVPQKMSLHLRKQSTLKLHHQEQIPSGF